MKIIRKSCLLLACLLIINNLIIIRPKANVLDKELDEKQKIANIVLFVNFADSTDNFMDERRDKIIDMYNGNSIKTLTNYLNKISNGKMSVVNSFPQDNGTVIIPYTLSKERSYYNSSSKEYEMIKEISNNVLVDENIELDMNNDGEVDNLSFVFEGSSNDRSDLFWPHKANHQNGSMINGKTVNVYNVHNENSILEKLYLVDKVL